MICAVCFGDPTSPLTTGLNYGIMTLLTILFIVLGSFAALFLNIRRRSRKSHI